MTLPVSLIGTEPRSDADHQHARFRAAARLGKRVRWFAADFDAPEGAPTDGSVIGPEAALCQQDASNHGVDPVTLSTIDRYLVLEHASGDERTCLPFSYPTLAYVQKHIELSAESADAILAIFDLDLERQVPVALEVTVRATFLTDRRYASFDAPTPRGPRVIATLVLQAWVGEVATEIDDGRITWDATPQIERMGRDAALALRDDFPETDDLVPPELLAEHTGPYRVEIAEAIPEYYAALDAAEQVAAA